MSKHNTPSLGPAVYDSLPPPYSEHDHSTVSREQAPQYEAPHFNGSTSDSTRLQAATSKFPPAMNGYMPMKFTPELHLGPSASEKLYFMSIDVQHRKSIQTMILHDGPTDKHPPLASLQSDPYLREKPISVTFASQGELQENSIIEPLEGVKPYKRMSPTFSIAHGKEIKELAGHTTGWKLVRLSEAVGETGGSRSQRAMGCSSDGKEIVAVIAHNASLSLSKGFKFAFVGSGLTGVLGEKWETMTLITAVYLWLIEFQIATHVIPIA
ncbi:hypothetical protein ANOM_002344 [Aspergillus nomiae NRRL 13137]|uniref:Uncharacterized protein n=1 Tax=Aspergillus nomiae NRRL (strain ATCC 15546 / NRRL 13137 / CBS 260.88 / M93) TaxID=1509407 RepID=A0A0L1JD42_ASPN3|nr:uncharacterized protein ANOM_002344 [Aspergillus nomiae NRRL 13137]KNG89699.1 hypothetical protein ANOM_002344 [Aspergillus nomiae NRRL 13137]